MTFEGRNFDILADLSAPLVYYAGFRRPWLGRRGLLEWNVGGLLLLLNIVVHAVLAAPTVVQQVAFDQPNIAILYFPFIALPSCLVPLVALSHLAAIRRVVRGQGDGGDATQTGKSPLRWSSRYGQREVLPSVAHVR